MSDNVDGERPKRLAISYKFPEIWGEFMVTIPKALEIAFVATTSNNRIRQVYNESLTQSMIPLPVLSEEKLWFECADKLVDACYRIFEFSQMIPGFSKICDNDQLLLCTFGVFELAVIRMSRYINPATNYLLFNKTTLPERAFYTTDVDEMDLVSSIFKVAKDIADLKLTVAGLGMYSAIVLLNDELPELMDRNVVRRLKEDTLCSFKTELDDSYIPPLENGMTVYDALIAKIPELRVITLKYVNAVANFKRLHPHFRWPEKHEELFGQNAQHYHYYYHNQTTTKLNDN